MTIIPIWWWICISSSHRFLDTKPPRSKSWRTQCIFLRILICLWALKSSTGVTSPERWFPTVLDHCDHRSKDQRSGHVGMRMSTQGHDKSRQTRFPQQWHWDNELWCRIAIDNNSSNNMCNFCSNIIMCTKLFTMQDMTWPLRVTPGHWGPYIALVYFHT